jgi:hypothetical protein
MEKDIQATHFTNSLRQGTREVQELPQEKRKVLQKRQATRNNLMMT